MNLSRIFASLLALVLIVGLSESALGQIGSSTSRSLGLSTGLQSNSRPTGYPPTVPQPGYAGADPFRSAYAPPPATEAPLDAGSGSLWSEGSYFNSPFDFEPVSTFYVGDHIVVEVQDNFRSKDDTRYKNETDSSIEFNLTRFLFKEFTTDPDLDMQLEGQEEYEGKSRGDISSSLTVEIPTEVKMIMPDGRLLIEGRTSRIIGRDIKQVLITGIVQPEDVDYDAKTVDGSRVLDMQVKWEGNGPGPNVLKPGFFHRFLDYIPIF